MKFVCFKSRFMVNDRETVDKERWIRPEHVAAVYEPQAGAHGTHLYLIGGKCIDTTDDMETTMKKLGINGH